MLASLTRIRCQVLPADAAPPRIYIAKGRRKRGSGRLLDPIGSWRSLVERLEELCSAGHRAAIVRVLGEDFLPLDRASRARIRDLETRMSVRWESYPPGRRD